MEIKPIPAFYCCYLLRSTLRHSALYVGSTPNPQRRLAQHNGISKGGAMRTACNHLRPWEMACIVSGFPSNVAALQFEWAWQNTHLTKRIAEEQRLTAKETKVHFSPKTGRTRKRPARPRASLIDKLSNLHLLLRVPSFARWPLEVRFFYKDVYDVWLRWSDRVDGAIRGGIRVSLDVKPPAESLIHDELPPCTEVRQDQKHDPAGKGGIEGIDAGYGQLKNRIEKSLFLLSEGEDTKCAICSEDINPHITTALVCPQGTCSTAFHMTCLAKRFLDSEQPEDSVLPTSGTCPKCDSRLQWIDLVKEMSLRTRGEMEMARLMKKPRIRKTKVSKTKKAVLVDAAVEIADDEAEGDHYHTLDEDDADTSMIEDPLPDDWFYQEDDDDDSVSVTSATSAIRTSFDPPSSVKPISTGSRLEIVINDSDWDDAEVLD